MLSFLLSPDWRALSDKLATLLGQADPSGVATDRGERGRFFPSLPGASRDALSRGSPGLRASAPGPQAASTVNAGTDPELLSGAGIPRKGLGLASPGRHPAAVAGTPEPGRTPAGARGRREARGRGEAGGPAGR